MRLTSFSTYSIHDFPYKMIVREDLTSLVEAFVDVLEDRLRNRLHLLAPKPLGLATGRTMIPVYRSLVARLQSWKNTDLEKLLKGWTSFNLDEYVGLMDGDPRSFGFYIMRYLGDPLGLNKCQIKLPYCSEENPDFQAAIYLDQLNELGGISVQLLGLGSNGHVGFNEPPCSADSSCRVVSLSESTKRQNACFFANDASQVPNHAITLGLNEILAAEEIHLIVTGASKSQVLNKLISSPCTKKLPASWLRFHERVFLWADKAALSYKD